MALNWVMTDASRTPLNLPGEKQALSVPSVELSLSPHTTSNTPAISSSKSKPKLSSRGTIHVTNKRIIFVSSSSSFTSAAPASSSTSSSSSSSAAATPNPTTGAGAENSTVTDEMNTLSVPLSHCLDGRLVQPWFGANYYEANVVPVEGGGLLTRHILTVTFKEGQSYEFVTLVEEMKTREMETSGGAHFEPLPVYEPPLPSDPEPSLGPGQGPIIPVEQLEAARVAEQQSQLEVQQEAARGSGSPVRQGSGGGRGDGPPGYESVVGEN